METKAYLGEKLIAWYRDNARDLPWRKTPDPYHIWISEVILQQTQVKQGLNHYLRFTERFPNVESLAKAHTDEVMLYWKGLGYYSRALNLHKAAQQIITDFRGNFPTDYRDIIQLKGVGKYTAAAVSSICFGEKIPAIDGNFYRVLSRLFADGMDISTSQAFDYYSQLALDMMPDYHPGDFNQAIMDLGAEICKPKSPLCERCPLSKDCLALITGSIAQFPVKTKRTKVTSLDLNYFFVACEEDFLIKRRGNNFIWKHLYEFPSEIPTGWQEKIINSTVIEHKLTHKKLSIKINHVKITNRSEFIHFAEKNLFSVTNHQNSEQKSFPKPLEKYITNLVKPIEEHHQITFP